MNLSDFIYTEKCLDKELCNSIIKLYDDNINYAIDATVFNGIVEKDIRNNSVIHIGKYCNKNKDFEHFDKIIFDAINKSFINYIHYINTLPSKICIDNASFLTGDLQDEGYMINKYIKNEGMYNWHTDNDVTKGENIRIISCIIYLNDVDSGGETDFGFTKIKPECGKILFFPALWTFLHRGVMPISHDKYIITTWFN